MNVGIVGHSDSLLMQRLPIGREKIESVGSGWDRLQGCSISDRRGRWNPVHRDGHGFADHDDDSSKRHRRPAEADRREQQYHSKKIRESILVHAASIAIDW